MELFHIHLAVKHLKAFKKNTKKVAMCPGSILTKFCFDCLLHGDKGQIFTPQPAYSWA